MQLKFTFAFALVLASGNLALAQNYYVPQPTGNPVTRMTDQPLPNGRTPVVRPVSQPTTLGAGTTSALTNNNSALHTAPGTTPTPNTTIGSSYLNQGSSAGCDGSGCDGSGCDGSGCDGSAAVAGSCDCCNSCCAYTKFFGGWNNLEELNTGATVLPGDALFNDGWAIGIARGKQITGNLRREFELVHRNNTVESIVDSTGALFAGSGNINATSIGNVLIYDFHSIRLFGATPYVGGGVGGVWVDADFDLNGTPAAISDNALAFQGLLGIQRQINQRVFGFAEYRFFGTTDLELEALGQDFDVNYETQTLFVGFRICR